MSATAQPITFPVNPNIYDMKSTITIVLLILLLTGCSEGYPDLGGGYQIEGEGGYATFIVDSVNNVFITNYILDWAVDSSFILVSQSPPDSLPRMKRFIYTESDRREIAYNKGIFRQYWIIEKKAGPIFSFDSVERVGRYSNVHGPYNKDQYIEQKAKLHVPQQLRQMSE